MLRQNKKGLFLVLCVFFTTALFAQNLDNIPCSFKKLVDANNPAYTFTKPAVDYSQQQAIMDNARLINEHYRVRDANSIAWKKYFNNLKIYTEGYADVIAKIPLLSTAVVMGKEYLYMKAEEAIDLKTSKAYAQFNTSIRTAFEADVRRSLKENGAITYNAAVANFTAVLDNYQKNLKPEDYQILAPIADKQILKFMQANKTAFEQSFETQKKDLENVVKASVEELKADFDKKFSSLQQNVTECDKEILTKVKENAQLLVTFNEAIEGKYTKLRADVQKMKADVEANKVKIEQNTIAIKGIKNDINKLKQLELQNSKLISENSYKIDVLAGVLYDNVNTEGKLKLLDMQFKNDTKNAEYLEKKAVLENIQTIEKVQYALAAGQELSTLAGNLNMSQKDLNNVNRALAIGNVLANGAMAYFTGNPVAGLQAVNGAFAVFGGGGKPNPEFAAIMAEFAKIHKKLDEISNKIDSVNANINDLKKLNVDLFIENQKRFTRIDEKLDKIQMTVNDIKALHYASSYGLETENASQYQYLWSQISSAKTLKELQSLYNQNPAIKKCVIIVHDNSINKTTASKTFLHFQKYDQENYWEGTVYKPILQLTKQVKPDLNYNTLERSFLNLKEYEQLLYQKYVSENETLLPAEQYADMETLIYPQAVVTLTQFTSLFEPYYYFSSAPGLNDFSIATDLNEINFQNKNKNLQNQFANILRENRKAIIQANLMSGITLLTYLHKHITEPSFKVEEKKAVYNMLTSQNQYLKINLANHIINHDIQQKGVLYKFDAILNATNWDSCVALVNDINGSFDNAFYNIAVRGTKEKFGVYVALKPMNINTVDETKNEVLLPLPSFIYLNENKVVYPEYLASLYENENELINKMIKYDAIEKMSANATYTNLKLLK